MAQKTVTVKELKEFLDRQSDDDRVYMASAFDSFDIVELKERGNDGYHYEGYVVLRGLVR